jgi:two-component system chemotaxis response regulator CheY
VRALIVDDSRAMRMMIARMMQGFGFVVAEAADGREALAALSRGDRPDVVLLDWNMPEVNGFDVLTAIRRDPRLADMPVVMVTTETEISQMSIALEHGVSEYVMKPFTKDILLGKLELLGLTPAA